MLDFLELKSVFVIVHLLGMVLGMGAAVMTDIMFMKSSRDKLLDEKEVSFINLGSRTVWIGLLVIIISGASLFALNPERYLESDKFLAKMAVVAVLAVNGGFFHFKHLPFLRTQIGQTLNLSAAFKQKSYGLFISGAVSSVSWISALMLGSLRNLPYSFSAIMSAYIGVLIIGILSSLLVRKFFLNESSSN